MDQAVAAETTYDADYFGWANREAAWLRAGRLGELDLENLAEEIESLGKSEIRDLESRLEVLIVHLLKWRFRPSHRSRGWSLTIRDQRIRIERRLDDSPNLRPRLASVVADVYRSAVIEAMRETELDESGFPASCPYDPARILDHAFLPN